MHVDPAPLLRSPPRSPPYAGPLPRSPLHSPSRELDAPASCLRSIKEGGGEGEAAHVRRHADQGGRRGELFQSKLWARRGRQRPIKARLALRGVPTPLGPPGGSGRRRLASRPSAPSVSAAPRPHSAFGPLPGHSAAGLLPGSAGVLAGGPSAMPLPVDLRPANFPRPPGRSHPQTPHHEPLITPERLWSDPHRFTLPRCPCPVATS